MWFGTFLRFSAVAEAFTSNDPRLIRCINVTLNYTYFVLVKLVYRTLIENFVKKHENIVTQCLFLVLLSGTEKYRDYVKKVLNVELALEVAKLSSGNPKRPRHNRVKAYTSI